MSTRKLPREFTTCQGPHCDNPLDEESCAHRRYCSDACRQAAYRERSEGPPVGRLSEANRPTPTEVDDLGKRRPNGTGSVYWYGARRRWEGVIDLGRDERGKRVRRKVTGPTKDLVEHRLRLLMADPSAPNEWTSNGSVPRRKPFPYQLPIRMHRELLAALWLDSQRHGRTVSGTIRYYLTKAMIEQGLIAGRGHQKPIVSDDVLSAFEETDRSVPAEEAS